MVLRWFLDMIRFCRDLCLPRYISWSRDIYLLSRYISCKIYILSSRYMSFVEIYILQDIYLERKICILRPYISKKSDHIDKSLENQKITIWSDFFEKYSLEDIYLELEIYILQDIYLDSRYISWARDIYLARYIPRQKIYISSSSYISRQISRNQMGTHMGILFIRVFETECFEDFWVTTYVPKAANLATQGWDFILSGSKVWSTDAELLNNIPMPFAVIKSLNLTMRKVVVEFWGNLLINFKSSTLSHHSHKNFKVTRSQTLCQTIIKTEKF